MRDTQTPFYIRTATAADVPAVVELWHAFMADQNRYVRQVRRTRANRTAMAAHLTAISGHAQVLVLVWGESIVGYAALGVNPMRLDSFYASASVTDLYVAPTARGRGHGRELLRAAIAVIRARGLHAATITVASGNAAALALYRSVGFLPQSETLLLPFDPELVRFGAAAPEA